MSLIINALKFYNTLQLHFKSTSDLEASRQFAMALALPTIVRPDPVILKKIWSTFHVDISIGLFTGIENKVRQQNLPFIARGVWLLLKIIEEFHGCGNNELWIKDLEESNKQNVLTYDNFLPVSCNTINVRLPDLINSKSSFILMNDLLRSASRKSFVQVVDEIHFTIIELGKKYPNDTIVDKSATILFSKPFFVDCMMKKRCKDPEEFVSLSLSIMTAGKKKEVSSF